uniref:Fibronectin type-III domain-containing protein n=1 Tax=Astyanax mexicanus TaxID=7994 RepID=A0A8B9H0Z6_ASTMX
MLYDSHSDSFNSGVFLWDEDTLSTMRLSLPRPHTDVRILEGKSLQDGLRALDLTTAVRASVVSGLVEVSGAAAFLKHPTKSHLQDRVTVHYKATTRLDMLSHKLLHSEAPLLLTNQNSATHVVVAVLYGAQAYFVLDEKNERSEGSGKLKDEIRRNVKSQNVDELLLNLEQADCFCECDLYADGEDFKHPVDFKTAVKKFRSLHELLEPDSERAVPLKVWLYPLKNLKPASAYVVGNISKDLLNNAVDVLEHLEKNINISQDMMSIYSTLGVPTWYPGLKEALFEYSALLQKYQSVFQKKLASCIRTVRERGEDAERKLQDLLKRNAQSPFSPQNMHHWLLNKDAKVVALNDCRSANMTILKSQKDLQKVIEDSQKDTVLCFALSSLEAGDPFLSALKQHIDLLTTLSTQEVQPPFRLPDISQKILNDLHSFLSSRETNEDSEHTKFIAISEPQPGFPGRSVCLYQFGNVVRLKINLKLKPAWPEIISLKTTCVILRLERSESSVVQWYRVEYRAVVCRGNSPVCLKWSDTDICSVGEGSVIWGLKPNTQYQLRYAVMDSNSMSDYSRITEFQTLPRARPGQPIVLNQNSDCLTVGWQSPEADEDSPVLRYMVEYMEAGLEGWQSVLTKGPESKYIITHPYSTCYRVRVSAVYGEGDTREPSEEKEVTLKSKCYDCTIVMLMSQLFLAIE